MKNESNMEGSMKLLNLYINIKMCFIANFSRGRISSVVKRGDVCALKCEKVIILIAFFWRIFIGLRCV